MSVYKDVAVNSRAVGDRIRSLREQKGWSQEFLGQRADLNKETVNRVELGANVRFDTYVKLAAALETSVAELFAERDDVQPGTVDVADYVPDDLPVIAEGEASPQGALFWDDEGRLLPRITDRISRPAGLRDPRAYGVRVRGDSMRPKYEPGDVLVVSPNLPVRTGLRCYVELKTGERLVKQVRKTMGGWMLESINQAYEPREVRDDEIVVMHRILWAREASESGGELKMVDESTGRRLPPRGPQDA
jgi:phage repressor protein C with HTH and peptisase S24 domain